jgi:hypothetical protein
VLRKEEERYDERNIIFSLFITVTKWAKPIWKFNRKDYQYNIQKAFFFIAFSIASSKLLGKKSQDRDGLIVNHTTDSDVEHGWINFSLFKQYVPFLLVQCIRLAITRAIDLKSFNSKARIEIERQTDYI